MNRLDALAALEEKATELAEKFGVSVKTIQGVQLGRHYADVA